MMKSKNKNGQSVKPERLTITLGAGQRKRISAIASQRRTSAATVIRWALDEYIAANAADGVPKLRHRTVRSHSRRMN